ncbi:MAG: Cys-tRNA(Pro) deacylase [Clostridia bacterium]|nr:Cys-tRNA(Pro) deacylase [Clostridia bacterium]
MKEDKTQVMRALDKAKVSYGTAFYDANDGQIDGVSVAHKIGADPAIVYKTLLTRANDLSICVCVLPVEHELDLKKAARAHGKKSLSMLPVSELLSVSGYVRGGCSPLYMKKRFSTVINESARSFPGIYVSAGRIGAQILIDPAVLATLAGAVFADVVQP